MVSSALLPDLPRASPLPPFPPLDSSSVGGVRRSTAEVVLRDSRVQAYLLKPKTWQARTLCLASWAVIGCTVAATCWWLIPWFLKAVVAPVQEKVKRDWSPLAVTALVFCGVALAPTVLLPAGAFIWLAAVSFGVWKGYLLVQLGTAAGMTASYFLGKHLMRKRIQKWVMSKDWAQALFIAVREAGPFKVVLLMRLGPAPYAWLSYACSLSEDIRYLPYIAASVLGRSPHNLIDIYIGSGVGKAGEAAAGKQLDPLLIAVYAVGFIFALGISVWGYLYARRVLVDLRRRGMAREDVLAAFSMEQAEDADGFEEHSGRARLLAGLTRSTRAEDIELMSAIRHDNCPSGREGGAIVLVDASPKEKSLSHGPALPKRDSSCLRVQVQADCRALPETEGLPLMHGQTSSSAE